MEQDLVRSLTLIYEDGVSFDLTGVLRYKGEGIFVVWNRAGFPIHPFSLDEVKRVEESPSKGVWDVTHELRDFRLAADARAPKPFVVKPVPEDDPGADSPADQKMPVIAPAKQAAPAPKPQYDTPVLPTPKAAEPTDVPGTLMGRFLAQMRSKERRAQSLSLS